MNCSNDDKLCGVLTVESGLSSGVYGGGEPKVHGLWPQVGSYGNSRCCRGGGDNCSDNAPSSLCPGIKWSGCDPSWHGCKESGCADRQKEMSQKSCRSLIHDTDNPCWFPAHEWYKHGMCAGFQDSIAYTQTMAELGSGPISVMSSSNSNWDQEKQSICNSKYGQYVNKFNEHNKQIEFSVCGSLDSNGGNAKWNFCTASGGSNPCNVENYVGVL